MALVIVYWGRNDGGVGARDIAGSVGVIEKTTSDGGCGGGIEGRFRQTLPEGHSRGLFGGGGGGRG